MGAVHVDQGYIHEAQDRAFAIYDENVGPKDEKLRVVQDALARL